MLIETYLPNYHYREFHSIKIVSSSEDVYQQVINCDLSRSRVIKFLFRMRGMRQKLSTIRDISKLGFVKLDEKPGEEILFGIISNRPTFSGCEIIKSPSEFIEHRGENIIKAVINLSVHSESSLNQIVSTETRVWCGSSKMKKGFRIYWFFVNPFSRIVRRSMLHQIKSQLKQT
jgi:hypothetical protein